MTCWTNAGARGVEGASLEVKLEGYGFRWFRIRTPDQQTPP